MAYRSLLLQLKIYISLGLLLHCLLSWVDCKKSKRTTKVYGYRVQTSFLWHTHTNIYDHLHWCDLSLNSSSVSRSSSPSLALSMLECLCERRLVSYKQIQCPYYRVYNVQHLLHDYHYETTPSPLPERSQQEVQPASYQQTADATGGRRMVSVQSFQSLIPAYIHYPNPSILPFPPFLPLRASSSFRRWVLTFE